MTTKNSKDSFHNEDALMHKLLGGPLTFGDAIEALRLRDGISQVALAKKIGVSKQYLCDIEKGRRLASPEQAARFAKAFKHPPAVLVRLALQDSLNASGLHFHVKLEEEKAA